MKHSYSLVALFTLFATALLAKQTCYTETSFGELIDKITILQIKSERITDAEKLVNIKTELAILEDTLRHTVPPSPHLDQLVTELKQVNTKLWIIEDDIREKEHKQEFDAQFIELARRVYFTNDRRGEIKREINQLLGSKLVEEKKYATYNTNTNAKTNTNSEHKS